VVRQYLMAERVGVEESFSPHGRQEAEREGREGAGNKIDVSMVCTQEPTSST
jgi:hypothetical protein